MAVAASVKTHALAPVRSEWIAANAGSGKTTVLTRHVVKLLLLGVPPERICCITYTKAAAGEMRARVLKSLRELLLMDDAGVQAAITDPNRYDLRCTPEMLARARLLFGAVLDSPAGGIQLTTIHGFCQQLLRAFPREAGVPPHFTVLDEGQALQLQRLVKHKLLAADRVRPELAAAIALLAERSSETGFDQLIRKLLEVDLADGNIAQQVAALYDALEVEEGTHEQGLAAAAMDCLSEAQKQAFRAALPGLMAEKVAYKRTMADGVAQWLEGSSDIDQWLQVWLTKEFNPRSHIVKADFGNLTETVMHCIATAERFVAQRAALALAEESAAALVLAGELQKLYAAAKAERGVLDYDDLILRTRELLTLRDMVGWVMSKLDHRIDHLLVDEAQDTSAEQWHIAHAIIDELKEAAGSAGVPRSLFVVGDEKQSIFSFQGAAPELYARQREPFTQMLRFTDAPMETRELLKSYRSAPAILKAVDAVAAQPEVAAALGKKHNDPDIRHVVHHENKVGRVVLHPLIPYVEKEKAEGWVIPQDYAITQSTAQNLAERVADEVTGFIARNEWNAGDILILVRSRGAVMQPLLRALQKRKVPVAGLDRLVLSRHLAVKDLLALARWCASTHDDLALAQVLRSPLLQWSDEQLRAVAVDRGKLSLWSRLHGTPEAQTLERWRAASKGSAYDFLTAVLEVDDARRRFVARFGFEVHEILDELKEQSMVAIAGGAPNLASFAAAVTGSERQIKREMDAGAHDQVRVMTVHGAKGLEAPCVLMIDTVALPSTRQELLRDMVIGKQAIPLLALSDAARTASAWHTADTELKARLRAEYYRLLYVAMTRPSDALHVFGAEAGNGETKPESWYKIIERSLKYVGATERGECVELRDPGDVQARKTGGATVAVPTVPDWLTQAPAGRKRMPTLSPSGLGREVMAPFGKGRGDAARERGVRLHRVLQFLSTDSTRAQVDGLIAHLAPDWSQHERERAANEVWALFERERWLWQHSAQAEANISGTVEIMGRRYPVYGQIDRLVITPDEVVVLDYKTGRDVPADASGVGEGYLLQLKIYRALLETLYPGKRVRPAIIWTANAQLMWLDEAVSSIDWERANLPQMP